MKRTSPSLHFFASAATSATFTNMSSCPSFRGGWDRGRTSGRGRSFGRRSYSDRPFVGGGEHYDRQFVGGDSHLQQVGDDNQGFRSQSNRGSFRGFPQPSHSNSRASHYNPSRPPPPQQSFHQNQQFNWRPPPRFDSNSQFRPRPQQQHQFRPRAPKSLEYRKWESASRAPPPEWERFTILSYNILADYLVKDHWSKLYFHIPRYILDWERRKRSILFELGLWSADIMCFQEVDRFQDLKEELALRGYSGIWKIRTGNPVDGCAIFWRDERFKLLHEESLEFCKLGLRDNVAQICVFESLDLCRNNNMAALSRSLACGNKVVVCNIHVLFNPKRGEIKLGQIRVLLHRAHTISKLWDDAPVVLCGDFNSTPKSPLYNFIAEQKLDLMELPRDKISGQASAQNHFPRPPFNPSSMALCDNNSAQVVPASGDMKAINWNSILKVINTENPDDSSGNQPFSVTLSQPQCPMGRPDKSCISWNHPEGENDRQLAEQDSDVIVEGDKGESANCFSCSIIEEKPSILGSGASSSVSLVQDIVHDSTSQESSSEYIHNESIENRPVESEYPRTAEIDPSSYRFANSSDKTESNVGNSPLNCTSNPEYCEISNLDVAPVEALTPIKFPATGFELDEKVESLSLDEDLDGTIEDDSSFLSNLHNAGDSLLSQSIKECSNSHGLELDEMMNTLVASESISVKKSKYDHTTWTPVEIETATGSSDCTVMEHRIKLRSVYGEVQPYSDTRDLTGEPAVTSYHKHFLGTVDYIWRSEGLQTARVLAPIPKDVILSTGGFPTKKWGSDHIALVAELAFKNEISNTRADVQLQSHA